MRKYLFAKIILVFSFSKLFTIVNSKFVSFMYAKRSLASVCTTRCAVDHIHHGRSLHRRQHVSDMGSSSNISEHSARGDQSFECVEVVPTGPDGNRWSLQLLAYAWVRSVFFIHCTSNSVIGALSVQTYPEPRTHGQIRWNEHSTYSKSRLSLHGE